MDFTPSETLVPNTPVAKAAAAGRPYLTIRPARGWVPVHLGEMWQFRDLLFALAARDVKLRYKQTALGVIWVVLQPLLNAGILTFVFGTVAHMKSGPIPYFIFAYVGQMAWGLFNGVLNKAAGSLVGNANLISKVFFPRLILPLSSIPSALIDFSVALCMMAGLLAIYHISIGWGILLFPLWISLLLISSMGIGLIATSLMVSYRDVQYVLPLALQILLYASPIVYPLANVPVKLRFWVDLNPLCPIFEAIRWSVFGTGMVDWPRLTYGGVAAIAILFTGIYFFKRMEQKFADII